MLFPKWMKSMTNKVDTLVAGNIRAARKLSGMSQIRLADAIGCTSNQISNYESGKNRVYAGLLVDIANALGVQVADLFQGVHEDLSDKDHDETLREGLHRLHMRLMNSADCRAIEILAASLAKSNVRKQGD